MTTKNSNLRRIDFATLADAIAWHKKTNHTSAFGLYAVLHGITVRVEIAKGLVSTAETYFIKPRNYFDFPSVELAPGDVEQIFAIVLNDAEQTWGGIKTDGNPYGVKNVTTGQVL